VGVPAHLVGVSPQLLQPQLLVHYRQPMARRRPSWRCD